MASVVVEVRTLRAVSRLIPFTLLREVIQMYCAILIKLLEQIYLTVALISNSLHWMINT